MAGQTRKQLDADQRRSLTQKARHSSAFAVIVAEANQNLAINDQWRKLLPEHKELVLYR